MRKGTQKKLLFIVQLPPPVHGVSLMNQIAVNNPLWKEKYEVHVLPLNFGQTLKNIGKITFGKILKLFQFFFNLCYKLVFFRPHIVYFTIMPTGSNFYRDALFANIIKCFRVHLVFHLHGKGIREAAEQSLFKRWIYKNTFKRAQVICLSESLKKDVEAIVEQTPFVLSNGIDAKKTEPLNNKNNPPIIIYLSNLVKNKGIEVLLMSLYELSKENIPFSARIIGDSADYLIEDAKAFCVMNNLTDKVNVLGPKYNDDKLKELANGDIFVLPSFNECFPISILEAMQVGLPIIATAVGGIPDMIKDNIEGLLVEVNNSADLTKKLKSLLIDDQLRMRLGNKAKDKFYQSFTLDQFHNGLNKIFEQIASS